MFLFSSLTFPFLSFSSFSLFLPLNYGISLNLHIQWPMVFRVHMASSMLYVNMVVRNGGREAQAPLSH